MQRLLPLDGRPDDLLPVAPTSRARRCSRSRSTARSPADLVAGAFQGLTPTLDRRKVFFTAEPGALADGADRPAPPQDAVTFTFTVRVDERDEWAQILDETWRVMKYRFYDEKMHGRDWNAIRAKYEPLLKYVGANEDVYDLANEMIGELNASHTGVSGPPSRAIRSDAYQTRYLGFELEPADGGYRVVAHLSRRPRRQGMAQPRRSATTCSAIDGTPIKAGDNYWQLLNSPLNEYVTVTRRRRHRPAPARERADRYDRVAHQPEVRGVGREEPRDRRQGDERPDRLRPHPSMNQPSLVRFQNEINQFWNKKGIIVDIRYNGGGNIDQEMIDILERRPYRVLEQPLGRAARGAAGRGRRSPGPKVMLINWRSGSDSEVTPMAFKQLGLGRIVGNPTSAAVIATGSYALINGGSIRTPGSLVVTYDPTKPEQLRHQPRELRRRAGRVGREHAGGRAEGRRSRAAGRDRRSDEDAEGGQVSVHDDRAGRRQVAVSEILPRGEFTKFEGRSLAEFTETNSTRRHGGTEDTRRTLNNCCAVTERPVAASV